MENVKSYNKNKIYLAIFIKTNIEILKINLRFMDLSKYNIIVVSSLNRKDIEEFFNYKFIHISVPEDQDFDNNFLDLCKFSNNLPKDSWITILADDDIILNSQTVNGDRFSDFSEEIENCEKRGSCFTIFEHAEYSSFGIEKDSIMTESSQFTRRDRDVVSISSMNSPYLVHLPRFCGIAYQAKILSDENIRKFLGTLHAYAAPMYLSVINGLKGEFIPIPRFSYYAPQNKSWSWATNSRVYMGIMHFGSSLIFLGYDEKSISDWPRRFHVLLQTQ